MFSGVVNIGILVVSVIPITGWFWTPVGFYLTWYDWSVADEMSDKLRWILYACTELSSLLQILGFNSRRKTTDVMFSSTSLGLSHTPSMLMTTLAPDNDTEGNPSPPHLQNNRRERLKPTSSGTVTTSTLNSNRRVHMMEGGEGERIHNEHASVDRSSE